MQLLSIFGSMQMKKDSLSSSIKLGTASDQEKSAYNILVSARKRGSTLCIIAGLLGISIPKTHRLIRSKCRNIKLMDYNSVMRLSELSAAPCYRCNKNIDHNENNEFKFTGGRTES